MTPQSPHSTLPASGLALLVLLALFWGFNWPIMKIVLTEWPVWTFRAICAASGAIGLFTIAGLMREKIRVPDGQWARLSAISFFNITGWNILAVYAVGYLPSGRAAILAFTMPLWGVILSRFMLDEKLTQRRLLGLGLGLSGLALLIGSEFAALRAAPIGALLMIGAAIMWAIGTVAMKRFPVSLGTTALTAWQMLLGGLPMAAGALLLDGDRFGGDFTLVPFLGVLYNMLVCFIFCYWAWFRIVSLVPVGISSLSTLMVPCVGVLSGALVLGERPGWQEYAALLLVIAALATVLLPARAARRPRLAG